MRQYQWNIRDWLICLAYIKVPFRKDFSPSGEQLEHRKLAHELWQPTASSIAIYHKYCCYTKRGGITTNWLCEIIWGTLPMCQNTKMRVNGTWIKIYCVLCSKIYNTSHSCHNFPSGSPQAARGACICETSLLHVMPDDTERSKKHFRKHSVCSDADVVFFHEHSLHPNPTWRSVSE